MDGELNPGGFPYFEDSDDSIRDPDYTVSDTEMKDLGVYSDSDQDPEDVFSQKEKVNSPEPTQCLLPFAKVDDLKRLFKFMPAVDITFIRTFFKEYNNTAVFAKSKKTLQKAKANSKVSETNRKINKGKSKSNTESTKGIKKCKP